MTTRAVITLLTDFGLIDSYVGQMRGVIAAIAPSANVIDLTHAIAAQDVLQGAILWADAVAAFPPGTIHVGVVDPGVGAGRRAIAADIGAWRFIAPDNGLLTAVRHAWPTHAVVELNRGEWFRESISATFHGRDVFAPAAAHCANGIPLHALGTKSETPLVEIEVPKPTRAAGELQGRVLWPDRFGNLITNITRADVPADMDGNQFTVNLSGRVIRGVQHCYGAQPPGALLALWNSSDRLEIAACCASAATLLGIERGAELFVNWLSASQQAE